MEPHLRDKVPPWNALAVLHVKVSSPTTDDFSRIAEVRQVIVVFNGSGCDMVTAITTCKQVCPMLGTFSVSGFELLADEY